MTSEMDITKETNKANKEIAAETNQANKDIAQMNNEFNLNMLDKQIEYNKQAYAQQRDDSVKFWNMQNEYNDPSKQMERLDKAGINAYQALGAVSSGSSGSISSSQMQGITTPTASPYQAVGYTAIKPDLTGRMTVINQALQGVQSALDGVNKTRMTDAQVAGIRLDNEYQSRTLGARVGSALAGTQGQQLQNQYQKMVNSFTPALMSNNLTAGMLANVGQGITNAMMDKNLDFLPIQQRLQLADWSADFMNKLQDGVLKGKQIEEYKYRIQNSMEESRGKKFTNDQNERLEEYLDTIVKNNSTPDWRSNPVGATRGIINELQEFRSNSLDTVPGTNGKVYGRVYHYGPQDTLKHVPWWLRY